MKNTQVLFGLVQGSIRGFVVHASTNLMDIGF